MTDIWPLSLFDGCTLVATVLLAVFVVWRESRVTQQLRLDVVLLERRSRILMQSVDAAKGAEAALQERLGEAREETAAAQRELAEARSGYDRECEERMTLEMTNDALLETIDKFERDADTYKGKCKTQARKIAVLEAELQRLRSAIGKGGAGAAAPNGVTRLDLSEEALNRQRTNGLLSPESRAESGSARSIGAYASGSARGSRGSDTGTSSPPYVAASPPNTDLYAPVEESSGSPLHVSTAQDLRMRYYLALTKQARDHRQSPSQQPPQSPSRAVHADGSK